MNSSVEIINMSACQNSVYTIVICAVCVVIVFALLIFISIFSKDDREFLKDTEVLNEDNS